MNAHNAQVQNVQVQSGTEAAGDGASGGAARVSAARPRKLHVGHFAFMRCVVQGLDLRQSWERYLRLESDLGAERSVRATIQWIRDEFAAAARRQARPGTARLVLIDASRIGDSKAQLPTLDAFAAARGLRDFSEAEQLEAYEAEYGPSAKPLERRTRLITKQLEALRWLESLVAQPPRAGDAVASWLNPTLAGYLEAAEIFTIAQLVDRVNGVGRRWAGSIKALGPAKGARIEAWLREHEASLGMRIGAHVAIARSRLFGHELNAVVAPASQIRPLEKFIVPVDLDGSEGIYRRPPAQCLLKATNDYEAILAWLKSKQGLSPEQKAALKARRRHRDSGYECALDWLQSLSNTQRAYRKEAERFLLWAVIQKGKPLSSMTNEDCVEYRDFIADPQPRSQWCAERSRERWSPLWRPFEGPLAPSAQRQAITILKNLCRFLVDQNYLMGNPWSSVVVPKSSRPMVNAGRSFTARQWQYVEEQLEALPQSSATQRLRFALHLLYATGLRLSEVVAASVDDLRWVEYPGDADDNEPVEGWLLRVIGKGRKEREVPVPIEVVAELATYLASRGLDPEPESLMNRGAPLLGKASDAAQKAPGLVAWHEARNRGEGIAASTFYDQLKGFFGDCGDRLLRKGDHKGAARFARASTHWLRHTHASHAIANGMPIEVAQQNLGHASLATTTIYVKAEDKRRMKAVARFWEGKGA